MSLTEHRPKESDGGREAERRRTPAAGRTPPDHDLPGSPGRVLAQHLSAYLEELIHGNGPPLDGVPLGAGLDPAQHCPAGRHARRARGHRVRRRHQCRRRSRPDRPDEGRRARALQGARRRGDRAGAVRGSNDGPDLGVRAERGSRAGRLHGPLLGDQQGPGPRSFRSAPQRQRDAAAGADLPCPGALRHAGRVPDHLPRVLRHCAPHDGRQDHRRGAAMTRTEQRLAAANVTVALVALFGGVVTGLFQALEYAGVEIYSSLAPVIRSHYHSVSIHGVLNALVFTTFFICGFVPFVLSRSLQAPLASARLGWLTFWVMVGGLVLASIPLVGNAATVMFTFYPPLQAHWAFYVGLTLVVVGTWLVTLNLVLTWRAWRAQHAGERTPLAAFMALVTFAMWSIASLGLAAEMLGMLIPWSLGWQSGTDPLLARTLFWFTGHPIVYFWLLPAYVSWYTLIPQQAGGRLFSDPMARASFILFLLLSTPVGMHHQFTDPGIGQGWKLFHAFLTFAVFFPSLLTFFYVVASLESGARARGGKGLIVWFRKLPWGEPSLTAHVLAMLLFAFGGIGGLVNASYSLNLVVHNTAYIVGHFHLTVGTAVP